MNFTERHESKTVSKTFSVTDPDPIDVEFVSKPVYPDSVSITYTERGQGQGWTASALVIGHTRHANGNVHETGWTDHYVGLEAMPQEIQTLVLFNVPA